jgi:hypothetical protein
VAEYDVIVLGDIIGGSDEARLVRYLYTTHTGLLVLHPSAFLVLFDHLEWEKPAGPRIVVFDHDLTLRFMNKNADHLSSGERVAAVDRYTNATQCVGVSAGYPSWVSQGERSVEVLGGGVLHTDGAESVRCGIIGGVIASMMLAPFEGAHLGSHLFGVVGRSAASELGDFGVLASDLPLWVPKAIRTMPMSRN